MTTTRLGLAGVLSAAVAALLPSIPASASVGHVDWQVAAPTNWVGDGSTVMEVFAPDGTFIRAFDMGDTSLSTGLIDFAFGPDGNLYIAGSSTARVLDPEGTVVVERFAPEFLDASNTGVHGIAVDSTGRVYIGGNSTAADGTIVAAVYQFDANGQMLGQFGRAQQRINWGEPFQPEELAFTVSIATLPDGRLAISDLNGAYSQLLAVTMAA